MKKFFKVSAFVLGLLVLGALFTSCNNLDSGKKTVAYIAEGNVGGGISAAFVVANFQAAINNAVGSGYVQQNDSKVISACDAYYKTLSSDTSLSGSVKIRKVPYEGGSGTVIKEYTFKKK